MFISPLREASSSLSSPTSGLDPILHDQGGKKRVFLGLLSVSCLIICVLLFVFLVLPWLGINPQWLRHVSVGAAFAISSLLGWICLTLVFHIYTGWPLPGIQWLRHLCIRLFLPLMEIVGKVAGIDKMLVRRSFIKVNNEFVCKSAGITRADRLLVLLPHCMQASTCKHRLMGNLTNCVNCGKCQVGAIKALTGRAGVKVAIATGGTIARKIVAETRPEIIIAIACERDLTTGIQDCYPIPVLGILNCRPNGPCQDTSIPLEALSSGILYFLSRHKHL